MDRLLVIGNAEMWKTHKRISLGQVVSSHERYGRGGRLQVHVREEDTAKVTILENTTIYHEIDFRCRAQRFNINFSYITQKGLPLFGNSFSPDPPWRRCPCHRLRPFFGFSRKEVQEAIDDLVERGAN